jgi:hypothetical protein
MARRPIVIANAMELELKPAPGWGSMLTVRALR